MRLNAIISVLAAHSISASEAFAYGAVRGLAQDAEHERITRRALACDAEGAVADCFQRKSLDKLAGKRFSFGAVGYPDKPTNDMPSQPSAHCDGGDHLNTADYPQREKEARVILSECRDWMNTQFLAAVAEAENLLTGDGEINDDATELASDCIHTPNEDATAKCNVLTHFGIMLHAVQDFYSHSNWIDRIDKDNEPGPRNPPGLDGAGPAPWLTMPIGDEEYPAGLISGCYEGLIEARECNYKDADGEERQRVKHAFLNKDKGVVDPQDDDSATNFPKVGDIGSGTTDRGKVNGNFEQSVSAAILDTRAKLQQFRAALAEEYGKARAALMICAVTNDKPAKKCTP